METSGQPTRRAREELLHLLSLSATMAGLCITGVTLFYTVGKPSSAETIVDDIFATCALLFLLCTYATFWSLRARKPVVAERFEKIADVIFAIVLTGMVTAGFVMVFTVW